MYGKKKRKSHPKQKKLNIKYDDVGIDVYC